MDSHQKYQHRPPSPGYEKNNSYLDQTIKQQPHMHVQQQYTPGPMHQGPIHSHQPHHHHHHHHPPPPQMMMQQQHYPQQMPQQQQQQHQSQFVSSYPSNPLVSQVQYNPHQVLQSEVSQIPSRYQPQMNYPYDFHNSNQTHPLLTQPHFYPYEYEEAMRETAKKLRKQEQMNENSNDKEGNRKTYKVPTAPYKPTYIDVEEFAAIFREMIMYEVKCEALRVQLALQPDFRIPVLWRIYNRAPSVQSKGQQDLLSIEDFVKGCKSFSVDADPVDIKLLMSKYKNLTKEASKVNMDHIKIDYQEFYALFYPLSKGDIFDQKLNTQDTDSDRFFYRTNMLIERIIRMMLSQEDAYEYFRREIVRKNIDLKAVYDKMNIPRDKNVNSDELRLFLIDYGLAVTKEDLMLFMMRLDKENTGTFSYDDFKREFTPRLSLKR